MMKKNIVVFCLVVSYILLTILFVVFVLLIFPIFTENTSISQYVFLSEREQNIWGIRSLISIVFFSIIAMRLRDLNWNMGKSPITKKLDKIFSSHFRYVAKGTKSNQFLDVLDYLFSIISAINSGEDLVIFECYWFKIERIINKSFRDSEDDPLFKKVAEINDYILLLKTNPSLFRGQKGFDTFLREEYENLHKKDLMLKVEF